MAHSVIMFVIGNLVFNLEKIQSAIQDAGFDGWLLYDFRGSNPLSSRVAKIASGKMGSRRWYYFIPRTGEPTKIVHSIESDMLDHLPGKKHIYIAWQKREEFLFDAIKDARVVAMEYSPRNANPYVSRVDAGTIELITSQGVTVVSSGDLVQQFEALLTQEQWKSHQEVSILTEHAFHIAWDFMASQIKAHGQVSEAQVLEQLMNYFHSHDLETGHPPMVSLGPHAAIPHYETGIGQETTIRSGSLVLIDLWAKFKTPGAIYSDLTKMCFIGEEIPQKYVDAFAVITAARDAGVKLIQEACDRKESLPGAQVDRTVRKVIDDAGFGDYFTHRTGHSLGQEIHGNGAHLDDIETTDTRSLLPRTLFTIEPGVYIEGDFGCRTEINCYIDEDFVLHITGGTPQTEIRKISL